MSRRFSRAESNSDLLAFLDRGHSANNENRWTFEIAWEVANKGRTVKDPVEDCFTYLVLFSSWRNLHCHPIEGFRVD